MASCHVHFLIVLVTALTATSYYIRRQLLVPMDFKQGNEYAPQTRGNIGLQHFVLKPRPML